MSKPSSSSIFRVVQGIIRITNELGDAFVGIIGDRLKVDGGLARNVKITNIDVTDKDTKTEHIITDEVVAIKFNTKANTKMSYITYSFDSDEYDGGNTKVLEEGKEYFKENLLFTSKKLYFSVDRDDVKIEVEEWY